MPTLAKFMAIPPPMVPAPMMPTLFTSRTGVSLARPLTLEASRSPKKEWIRPARWGDSMHSMNSSRSRFMPSSKGRLKAASTASTHLNGENRPRARFFKPSRNWSKTSLPFSASILSVMSRTRRTGLPSSAIFWANARPTARISSPSSTASRIPRARASLAPTNSPVVIISSAFWAPVRRGRRWVPPAPGNRPSFTSGRPTLALLRATR